MEKMSPNRQLAAIMFTDIVGYTALMGSDEDKAFEVLRKNQDVHNKLIGQFNGTLIKEMGDGMLISFPLASEAVRCAIEIQKACKEQDIPLKIGIHEGEMVFAGSDVLGDSVNIASRLQEDADEGSIHISSSVYKNVKNKADINTKYLGERTFKNVDEPAKVYKVLGEGEENVTIKRSKKVNNKYLPYIFGGAIIILTVLLIQYYLPITTPTDVEKDKSIAVIPFWNDSPDPDNAYFCRGMEDEIRIHLLKIGDLRLESRQSVEKYRQNPDKDLVTIGKELDVTYIVEGAVRKVNNDIRITVRLIDATTGDQVWAETYNGDYTQKLLEFEASTAMKIANAMNAVIKPEEEKLIERLPTSDLTAYDFYLKGVVYYGRSRQLEDYRYAIQLFERAVEIDPDFTLAWVGLASASRRIYWFHYDRSEEHLAQTKEYLDKAIALDPELLEVQLETGMYYYHCKFNYPKALQILEKLKSEYPNNDQLRVVIGFVYRRMGQFEKAFEYMNHAISLYPSGWESWSAAGATLTMLGRYTQAEEYIKTSIDLNPSETINYIFLARSHLATGEVDNARALLVNNQNIENPRIYKMRSQVELIDQNYEEAISILESSPLVMADQWAYSPKSLQLGLIYYVMSDKELANTHFQVARQVLEDTLSGSPDDSRLYSSLGIVYAGLGMREEAVVAGNKALAIINITVEAFRGFYRELDMARILLMIGEYDEAIAKLEFLIQQNGLLSVELLKKDPLWNPLRDIDAFKALIANPRYQIILDDN